VQRQRSARPSARRNLRSGARAVAVSQLALRQAMALGPRHGDVDISMRLDPMRVHNACGIASGRGGAGGVVGERGRGKEGATDRRRRVADSPR
jgi:hypothetical protein